MPQHVRYIRALILEILQILQILLMRLSSFANPVHGSSGGTGLKASHDVAMRLDTGVMIPALEGVHPSALITLVGEACQSLRRCTAHPLASPNYR